MAIFKMLALGILSARLKLEDAIALQLSRLGMWTYEICEDGGMIVIITKFKQSPRMCSQVCISALKAIEKH